jgi:hypothetical protein
MSNIDPQDPLAIERLNAQIERKIDRDNASSFLFNCIIWISAVSPLYFPEDQQKEATVLLKELKEKIRKLRGML